MKSIRSLIPVAGAAFALFLATSPLQAQEQPQQRPQRGGGGNFDPAQFRERMMERMREQFGVKDDDEWKLISARIDKINEARRTSGGGFGGFGGGTRGRGPGGPGGAPGGAPGGDNGNTRGRGGSPEQQALQQAIDSNASADEIKAKLEALRASRKAGQAELEKAQAQLKEVLSVKQEAVAVMMGLLP